MQWILILVLFPYFIPAILTQFEIQSEWMVILECVTFSVWTIYFLLWLIQINIRGFKLLLSSFVFWIKLFYTIQYRTFLSLLYQHNLKYYDTAGDVIGFIGSTIVILSVLGFDALNVRESAKVILSAFMALRFSYSFIYYRFLFPDQYDHRINIPFNEHSISCSEILAGSSQILALFFLMQCLNTIRRRDRCVNIVYYPFIEWIDSSLTNKDKMQVVEEEVLPETVECVEIVATK